MVYKLLLYCEVIRVYIYILFHFGLSQDIKYSSLCYRVGPCCLSILYIKSSASAKLKLPVFPPPTPTATICIFPMSVSLFLFCRYAYLCCILDFACKWYNMEFVCLFLMSFSMTNSKSIHVAANGIISLFLWLSNIHCVYITYFLYHFICGWTFKLFPHLGYYK